MKKYIITLLFCALSLSVFCEEKSDTIKKYIVVFDEHQLQVLTYIISKTTAEFNITIPMVNLINQQLQEQQNKEADIKKAKKP